MSKYFNPQHYYEDSEMSYRSTATFVTGLDGNPENFITSNIALKQNNVSFWSSKVLDVSAISSIFSPQEETFYDPEYLQNIEMRSTEGFLSSRYVVSLVQDFEVSN